MGISKPPGTWGQFELCDDNFRLLLANSVTSQGVTPKQSVFCCPETQEGIKVLSHSLAQRQRMLHPRSSSSESGQPGGFPDIELVCEPKVYPPSWLWASDETADMTPGRSRGQVCHQNTAYVPALPSAFVRTKQAQRLGRLYPVAKSQSPGDLIQVI